MFFYITCPFLGIKAFCLIMLSFYRRRSRQIHIKSLTSASSLQSNHIWEFTIFIVPVCKGHPQLIFGVAFCWVRHDGGASNNFLKVKALVCTFCYLSASLSTDAVSAFSDFYRKCIFFPFMASVFFLANFLLMCLRL